MWKLIKVAILSSIALALLAVSYPSWSDFVFPENYTNWDASRSSIRVDARESIFDHAVLRFESQLQVDQVEPQTGEDSIALKIFASYKNGVDQRQPLLLTATGDAIGILTSCVETAIKPTESQDEPSIIRVPEDQYQDSPTIKRDSENVQVPRDRGADIPPTSYFEVFGLNLNADVNLTCYVDKDEFWSTSQGQVTYSQPQIVVANTELGKVDGITAIHGSKNSGGVASRYGIQTMIAHATDEKVDVQTPGEEEGDTFINSADQAIWVEQSNPPGADPAVPEVSQDDRDDDYVLQRSSVVAQFTRPSRANAATRDTFIGGAMVGLLGGLAVEIASTAIDAAESRSNKNGPPEAPNQGPASTKPATRRRRFNER